MDDKNKKDKCCDQIQPEFSPRTVSQSTEFMAKLNLIPSTASPLCPNGLTTYPALVQAQTNWCWAAVAVSINQYYGGSWTGSNAQCLFVNSVFGYSNCCGSAGGSYPCNQTHSLDDALTRTGNFASQAGIVSFDQIYSEVMNNCRPVALIFQELNLSGSQTHVVVVAAAGYINGKAVLSVWDTAGFATSVYYNDFAGSPPNYIGIYPENGPAIHWVETIFTKHQ